MDAGSTPLIVFDTEGDVLFRDNQLGFPIAGGSLALASSGMSADRQFLRFEATSHGRALPAVTQLKGSSDQWNALVRSYS